MVNEEKSLVVFQDRKIRRTWFNDEWFAQGWGQIAIPLSIDRYGSDVR